MTYHSFHISDNPYGLRVISKNGKQVFTARWQECYSEEEARQLIDASLAMKERQSVSGKSESQRLHEAWFKKAILFREE